MDTEIRRHFFGAHQFAHGRFLPVLPFINDLGDEVKKR
jgi:hypothetical protein